MIKRIEIIEEAKRLIDAGKDVALVEKRYGASIGHVINANYGDVIDTAKWYRNDGYTVLETMEKFLEAMGRLIVDYTSDDNDPDTNYAMAEKIMDSVAGDLKYLNFNECNVVYNNNWQPYAYKVVPKFAVSVLDYDDKEYYLAVVNDDTDMDTEDKE